ncbi:unnamed protein product [Cuscuta campestris]|uniref:Retrotransposon Copia-like N-terminal domain-containing protein n=1 Tax=Cuscuta campestris TaxID=132261 RepID=A0A484NI25_9ASTE|nr:unnamed protein product [Cuscuta campestris]
MSTLESSWTGLRKRRTRPDLLTRYAMDALGSKKFRTGPRGEDEVSNVFEAMNEDIRKPNTVEVIDDDRKHADVAKNYKPDPTFQDMDTSIDVVIAEYKVSRCEDKVADEEFPKVDNSISLYTLKLFDLDDIEMFEYLAPLRLVRHLFGFASNILCYALIVEICNDGSSVMADANSSSSGKVTSTSENSSSNNSPHLAFTAISNIKLHIPVQLSLSEPNYKKWSRLFRLLILRFNLKGYIDGTTIASSADDAEWYQFDALIQGWILSTITDEVSDLVLANNLSAPALWTTIYNLKGYIDGTTIASSADDAEWYQIDALIQGWILSTITDEVSDLVLANNLSAPALWTAIYNLFHDHTHARAMQLEHRFRTTVKGQLSINEYCRLLKNISEYLDNVDAPVTEHALVLQQQTDAVYGAGAPSTALLSTGGSGGHAGSGVTPQPT